MIDDVVVDVNHAFDDAEDRFAATKLRGRTSCDLPSSRPVQLSGVAQLVCLEGYVRVSEAYSGVHFGLLEGRAASHVQTADIPGNFSNLRPLVRQFQGT